MSSGIISFAKISVVEEQVKNGDTKPRMFFSNNVFYFKNTLGFRDPQSFKTVYHLEHIKRFLDILLPL